MFGLSALVASTAIVTACRGGSDCDSGICDGPTVGTDGGSDALKPDSNPPGCDATKDQKDQAACLNDDFAVFVALTGRPDGSGTMLAPVNTVARAFELVGGQKQRIYVCEGTYGERVTLKGAVSIYGGLSCNANQWRAPGGRAVFKNMQQPGYALDVFRVPGVYELADLEFASGSGTPTAPNSIAARVVGSRGLVLNRVWLTAADAAEGAPGGSGKTGDRSPADGKGTSGTAGTGGGPNGCTCTVGGPTAGGAGGGALNGGGGPGTGDALPAGATDGQGGTGASTNCVAGLGHEGATAANQTPAASQTKLGAIEGEQWLPGEGIGGASGKSGQGGGGGGANNGGGGAGGCGGCGGSGGKGGNGGGASIALLAIDSPIRLVGCTLKTSAGGKGGTGGKGGSGGEPGGSGSGGTAAPNNGCSGGPGGRGGDGGHGSGGPGGIAVGVLFQGTAPKPEATEISQTGSAGPGGDPAAAGGNAGPAGKKAPLADITTL